MMAEAESKRVLKVSHDKDVGDSEAAIVTSRSKKEIYAITDSVKLAIASSSLLGVGCSAGSYLAGAGFFEHSFESSRFFLWMLMALYLPFPVMLLLQEKFDEHFDSMFGPRQTYFFRVIAVQIILAGAFASYSLSCESPTGVLVCGVLIGSFSAATVASTMQLMCAWEPHLAAWASVGRCVGGALPVVTYFLLEFSPAAATARDFQVVQIFPIVVICICAVGLTCFHFAGIWDKAYARLGYDLWDMASEGPPIRQTTESDPLLVVEECDEFGEPLWTTKWKLATGLNIFLSFMLMPLVTSMRNAVLTQRLVLGVLSMDCLSRCFAALMAKTDAFGLERPRHYMLGTQLTLRTICFSVLLAHVLHFVDVRVNTFLVLWYVHYFLGSFTASQIDVTIVRFAPVALRKAISRRNTFINYTGLALSLLVDVLIIFTL